MIATPIQSPTFINLGPQEKNICTQIITQSIDYFFKEHQMYRPSEEEKNQWIKIFPLLDSTRGALVKLKSAGVVRGEMGISSTPYPLYQTLIEFAVYSAFEDLKHLPLETRERANLEIDVFIVGP